MESDGTKVINDSTTRMKSDSTTKRVSDGTIRIESNELTQLLGLFTLTAVGVVLLQCLTHSTQFPYIV